MSDAAATTDRLLLARLTDALGPRGVLTGDADTAPYCEDWRGLYRGRTPFVMRPAGTAEVARALTLCAEAGVPVVPQGGNTSMVGGATPDASGGEAVLCLSRLNRVRGIDTLDMTLTVEAGVTLAAARAHAAAHDCLLPLSINSEGSAQIGGVLATNAGGNNTIRYGNARELVLGLEVVLADGQVLDLMRRLRKDNTGYCLRQLFVGSEGTLGVITAAILQLAPKPRSVEVAFCGLSSSEAVLELFRAARRHDPGALTAFEYMSGASLDLVLRHIDGASLPIGTTCAHYALIEYAQTSPAGEDRTRAALEAVLEGAIEAGLVEDAVLASSEAQRLALWRLREEHSEAQKRAGASIKNDVSVPLSRIPDLLREAGAACERLIPGVRVAPFGHVGDGNIHFNLVQPETGDPTSFLARGEDIVDVVAEVVRGMEGSFSAEHGVGQLKTHLMEVWRGGAELDAMRRIKAALDPAGLLNPGKIFGR